MNFNDRRAKADAKMAKDVMANATTNLKAKCGHEDMLGYFAGTVCGNCARKAQKKAMGK
jgi:hypothetical protein